MRRTRCFFDKAFINYKCYSAKNIEICLLVIFATRVHPVTSRTRKLRSSAPMVLGGQPPGRVGHCQETFSFRSKATNLVVFCFNWSLAPQVSPAKPARRVGHCQETFSFRSKATNLVVFCFNWLSAPQVSPAKPARRVGHCQETFSFISLPIISQISPPRHVAPMRVGRA